MNFATSLFVEILDKLQGMLGMSKFVGFYSCRGFSYYICLTRFEATFIDLNMHRDLLRIIV